MAVEVRKGVPMPGVGAGQRITKYPWDSMEVGDSFVFPENTKPATAHRMVHGRSKNGLRFASRTLPDGRVGCWRVA